MVVWVAVCGCYVVYGVFWVVFMGVWVVSSVWYSEWLLSGCYTVAGLFWVVILLMGCSGWLLWYSGCFFFV